MKAYISIVVLFVICGCKKDISVSDKHYIEAFSKTMIENNIFLLKDTILVSINDNQVLIAKKKPFKNESWIMLREVNKQGSFTNKDYKTKPKILNLEKYNKDLIVFLDSKVLNISKCQKIRIGEYYRDEMGGSINVWTIDIDYESLKSRTPSINRASFLGIDPRMLYFNFLREEGVFFKTSGELYIWYYNNTVFFIRNKVNHVGRRVMFHILDGNEFLNMDFNFNEKLSKKLMLSEEYEVAEIFLERDIVKHRIRVGEYTKNDGTNINIWAQEIDMKRVNTNELLRFQSEIEEASTK